MKNLVKKLFFTESWSTKIIVSMELRIAKKVTLPNHVTLLKNVTLFNEYHENLNLSINSSENTNN